MSEVKIFTNEQFGKVRVVEKNGEPWFVGKDIAQILSYSDTNKAVAVHVDKKDKILNDKTSSSFGQRGAHLINESGLYSLIMSSKLPQAKQFKHWVTSEVLPSIRKNGGYIADQENLSDMELLAKALIVAQNTLAEREKRITDQNKRIEEMRPKEIFADAVSVSKSSILIRELAKILKQNGVNMGQNRLYAWLRNNGFLIKQKGVDYNLPTQKSMNMGLFEIHEKVKCNSTNDTLLYRTTKVTGKGQLYFVDKFLNNPNFINTKAER